ncbi:MMPL family transporter [Streptomyces pseudovenezuelae]|uniref:RND superfamily putative drug exporter n=1 Tax=Streptomyces pseudovenezuelae TaxID=67350 RepID=A0ABT6LZ88_9ACTN|nr:MMPL family transporter [Streptomyces pseudovenezuelae]MDH6221615.1 RND superfamily putative drug exporter [Streptomyces pseudovenezuelae]
MAVLLYRLGRLSFRRRRLVLLIWLALLVAGVTGAVTLSGPTSQSQQIPGLEAQRALDQLEQKFPQAAADGATARVVFASPDDSPLTDPANRRIIERTVAQLAHGPQVAGAQDPFDTGTVSPDRTIAFSQVTYDVPGEAMQADAREALLSTADEAREAGLTVEIGGDALEDEAPGGITEIIGVAIAALVLLITFRSVLVAGLPLVTALIGVGIAMTGIMTLSGFVDLSPTTGTLSLMIGLAVAIDYALLIVSRYRNELATDPRADREEAAARAMGTAGSAVVFAGLTVIIALAGLSVVGVPFLAQMGLGAAAAVAVAILIALTLLPALLGFAGRRVTANSTESQTAEKKGRATMGRRWVTLVTRRPATALIIAALGLGVAALPALDLRLGLPDDGMATKDTTQRKAYDLVSEGFGPGFNGPLVIVVSAEGTTNPQTAAQHVTEHVKTLTDVKSVSPATVNPARDTALLQVVPKGGPNAPSTTDLVTTIRDQSQDLRAESGATVAVTGMTALNIDMSDRLQSALIPYLALVVGMAMLLLMLVFRSVLVPVKAVLGFLLTVGATFGAVVAVFQWGWLAGLLGVAQTGPIVSMMPIFLIGIVFGLAMDYQVFLVARMREEYVHGAQPTQAVVSGFVNSARVVTAAAAIMISVFFGFVLSADPMIKMMGFALASGVLLDAYIVRMTLVPAALTLLGRSAWWIPRWLNKLLPDVDIEGEKLRGRLGTEGQQQTPGDTALAVDQTTV